MTDKTLRATWTLLRRKISIEPHRAHRIERDQSSWATLEATSHRMYTDSRYAAECPFVLEPDKKIRRSRAELKVEGSKTVLDTYHVPHYEPYLTERLRSNHPTLDNFCSERRISPNTPSSYIVHHAVKCQGIENGNECEPFSIAVSTDFKLRPLRSLEYASDTVTEEELKKIPRPCSCAPNLVGRICLNH